MPTPAVQVDVVGKSSLNEVDKLNAKFVTMDVALNKVTSTLNKYNEAGEKSSSVVKGLTATGETFVATFKSVKGSFDLASVSIADNTAKTDQNKKSMISQAQASKQLTKELEELRKKYVEVKIVQENLGKGDIFKSAKVVATGAQGERATIRFGNVDGNVGAVDTRIQSGAGTRGLAGGPGGPFGNVAKDAEAAKLAVADLNKSFNDLFRTAQFFVTYKAFGVLRDQISDSFQAAREFQIQISLIRTLSQENQQSFGAWSKQIRSVSDELGLPLADTAKATFDVISNQVAKGRQAVEFVREAGQFARTVGGSVSDAQNAASSVIIAYNRSLADNEELFSLFFKTIDEGRINIKDFANNLGTLTNISSGLGVSIEDLLGEVAFLTQSGIKSDVALTFLRNTLLQLQKPSEAMVALFNKLGVSSSKSALSASGGLAPFIQKLVVEAKAANIELTQLIPELRGEQLLAAVANNPDRNRRVIDEFRDKSRNKDIFRNAQDIRGESSADFVNKEFNKLQNALTEGFGNKIVETVKDIIEFINSFSSLTKVVNAVAVATRNLTVTIIAARTSYVAATIAITLYDRVTLGSVATQQAAAAAARLNGASIASVVPAATAATAATTGLSVALRASGAALFVAGLAYLATDLLFTNKLLDDTTPKVDFLTEAVKKQQRELAKTADKKGFDFGGAGIAKDFDNAVSGAVQSASRLSVAINSELDSINQKSKETAQRVGDNFNLYVAKLKDGVADLSRQIESSRSIIKSLQKNLISGDDKANDLLTATKLQYGTDLQKLRVLDGEINRLRAKGRSEFNASKQPGANPELVRDAQNSFNEAAVLTKQRFDLEVEIAKKRSIGQTVVVNENVLLARLNALSAERVSFEKQVLKIKKEQLAVDEATKNKKEADLKNLDVAFKKSNEFTPFTEGGSVKTEFKNKLTGRLDIDKAKAQLNEYDEALRRSAGNNAADRIAVENFIASRRETQLRQFELIEQKSNAKINQDQILQDKRTLEQSSQDKKKGFDESASRARQFAEELKSLLAPLDQASAFADARVKQKEKELLAGGGEVAPDIDQILGLDRTKSQAAEIKKLISDFKAAFESLQTGSTVVNGQTVFDEGRINKLRDAYSKLAGEIKRIGFEGIQLPGQEAGASGEILANQLRDRVNGIQTESAKALEFLGAQLKLQTTIAEITRLIKDQGIVAVDAYGRSVEKIDEVDAATKRLIETIRSIPRPPDLSPLLGGLGAPLNDSAIPRKAMGGFVGGKPGIDQNLTYLSRGEYVVNAAAAYQYADVLESINRGRGNVNTTRGGDIMNTRVGDIVINYQGGGGSQADAKSLVQRISRELRKNNVKLT